MTPDLDRKIPMLPPDKVLYTVGALSSSAQDYNHRIMNIPSMWEKSKGAGVKVAILDTGTPVHRNLEPSGSWTFYDNYGNDTQGHATHVGGIAHAVPGVRNGVVGIAPKSEDYYAAVLDGSGSGTVDAIIAGIRHAVDDWGVDIINMSLGFGFGRVRELEDACNYAVNQGVTIFAASGNSSTRVGQPACYDSVVAVGAVDARMRKAGFSNYGPEIDFVAGGVDVYSTHLRNRYARLSGTSMACPALSAAAALIISKHRKNDVKLSPSEVVEHLERIAFDPGYGEFPEKFGAGFPLFGRTEPDMPHDRRKGFFRSLIFWRR